MDDLSLTIQEEVNKDDFIAAAQFYILATLIPVIVTYLKSVNDIVDSKKNTIKFKNIFKNSHRVDYRIKRAITRAQGLCLVKYTIQHLMKDNTSPVVLDEGTAEGVLVSPLCTNSTKIFKVDKDISLFAGKDESEIVKCFRDLLKRWNIDTQDVHCILPVKDMEILKVNKNLYFFINSINDTETTYSEEEIDEGATGNEPFSRSSSQPSAHQYNFPSETDRYTFLQPAVCTTVSSYVPQTQCPLHLGSKWLDRSMLHQALETQLMDKLHEYLELVDEQKWFWIEQNIWLPLCESSIDAHRGEADPIVAKLAKYMNSTLTEFIRKVEESKDHQETAPSRQTNQRQEYSMIIRYLESLQKDHEEIKTIYKLPHAKIEKPEIPPISILIEPKRKEPTPQEQTVENQDSDLLRQILNMKPF